MDKLDKQIIIEKYVNKLDGSIDDIKRLISFLSLEEKHKVLLDDSLKILTKKLNKVKKARSVKEANKYIKIKKILKKG